MFIKEKQRYGKHKIRLYIKIYNFLIIRKKLDIFQTSPSGEKIRQKDSKTRKQISGVIPTVHS